MIALLVAMTSSFSWLKRPTPGVKTGGFFIVINLDYDVFAAAVVALT